MKNLKLLREAAGLTRTELAYKLGMSAQSVLNWEKGRGLPRASMLCKIADFFGVTIDQLVGREPAPASQAS